MANTTPIVTTVTKTTTKEKALNEAETAPRINILDFCEEHYADILPVMDKIRRDKRRERAAPAKEGTGSQGQKDVSLQNEEDLAVPWSCEEVDPFTPRIRDPEDHVKFFQAAPQVERWAMPTWCHMFNSTLIGAARVWFDELPSESIDGYKDLKASFLAYFMQQKKYVKDLVEIQTIKQRDGETIEEFMERFKVETERMKGAPECMRISGFMHGVNNPELTKRLNEHVPKTMKEMMIATTAFIRGEAASADKKKVTHHGEHKTIQSGTLQRRGLTSEVSQGKGRGLTDLLPLQERQKKSSRPRQESSSLKKQIEELVRACKLSHLIKEIKQGRDQPKVGKKETPAKDKFMAIYMIQSWHRMTRQKVTQSFERVREIAFPSMTNNNVTEGTLVIEAKIGGHMIHRMYVDGGSSTEVLYEHCFNRLRPEVKNQMVTATTSLTGFSGETIWPLGQLRLLVTIRDVDHSTRAWMNFMIVRSLSPYNCIIGRPRIKEIHAVPSTAHGMLKFPADRRIVTIRSTILIPAECTTVITSSKEIPKEAGVRHENFKVALHPNFPDQIATPFQKSIGRLNLSTPTLYSVSWTLTKAITKYSWQSQMRRKRLSTLVKGCIAIQKCLSASTYQRLVHKAFNNQIGRNIKVYVDDLVIKSHREAEMLRDIGETFRTLRKINMKLNPKKCTFGGAEGMFLGYMISPEGIKLCPDKTEVVLQLPSPRTIKEVQSLNGKLASLNRFIFKSAEKSLPLFKTLKNCIKKSDFHWTSEAEQAFNQLKQHLSELPLLPITVITGQPIKQIISRPNMAGRLQKWSVMLGEHNITYRPRTSVKGQILVDFLAEMSDESPPDASVVETPQEPWTLFTDGSSCVDGSGAGLILTSSEGTEFTYALRFMFTASNNEAEYEALIASMRIASQMGVRNVHVSVDSKLVANQVLGAYVAKEENMIKYLDKVKSLLCALIQTSLGRNTQRKIHTREGGDNHGRGRWTNMDDTNNKIFKEGTHPGDRKEARKLRIKARQYELLEGVLYMRSFLTPWLICVRPLQADYVIRKIHKGSCSMHAGP
nr:hypothetical protein [Tanacetum cinerariifolium]